MIPFLKGRYRARLAETPDDLRTAQRLRWLCFLGPYGQDDPAALDADGLDAACLHLLVEDGATGQLLCCFRALPLASGHQIAGSYSAQFYDLRRLHDFDAPMIEIGRFCVHPAARDPDIIRTAWAALTRLVQQTGAQMLFGCSSFKGTDPARHAEAFAVLRARHLAPPRWLPRIKAPQVVRFARALMPGQPDPKRAMAAMPPLLRSYLSLGCWVSDHAVVDAALRTMHVFTGVEIGAIPANRRRLLELTAE